MTCQDLFRGLDDAGRAIWLDSVGGWLARPEDLVEVLRRTGFVEYRCEVARRRRGRRAVGGLWQGLDPLTGCVASMIWVERFADGASIVFVDVDGDLAQHNPQSVSTAMIHLDVLPSAA
jgi:hypothetical protein